MNNNIIEQKIFVSIASYRDNQLPKTVQSLLENAEYPERIIVGILHQNNFNEDKDCVYLGGNKNVIQHFVDYQTTLGLSWARNYIFSHILSDELFSLQIDSHIRFDKNWDTTLLNMYYSTNDEFAIISHYPTGYDSQTEIKDPKQYTRFIPYSFNEKTEMFETRTSMVEESLAPNNLEETFVIGGGCLFGKSNVFKNIVPYDPYITFNGEEQTYGLRLWTHGYNIYLPNKQFLWHDYNILPNKKTPNKYDKYWNIKSQFSIERCLHILNIKKSYNTKALENLHFYDLGKVRLLSDYEKKFDLKFDTKYIGNKYLK